MLSLAFMSSSVSNAINPYGSCEDEAWLIADITYQLTGDNFIAGEAFANAYASCNQQ